MNTTVSGTDDPGRHHASPITTTSSSSSSATTSHQRIIYTTAQLHESINNMSCPFNVNSNTIELIMHTSCYCVLEASWVSDPHKIDQMDKIYFLTWRQMHGMEWTSLSGILCEVVNNIWPKNKTGSLLNQDQLDLTFRPGFGVARVLKLWHKIWVMLVMRLVNGTSITDVMQLGWWGYWHTWYVLFPFPCW